VQVILFRHAEAAPETLVQRDPHRHLTPEGRAPARALGRRLEAAGWPVARIWSSPLVRAVQTAELVAAELSGDRTVEILVALAPDGNVHDVEAAVGAGAAAGGALVLVGHEPALSAIGDLLIQGELAPLDKAQAVRIDGGVEQARLAWNAAG
jgi:phosphohistidine phosphatase